MVKMIIIAKKSCFGVTFLNIGRHPNVDSRILTIHKKQNNNNEISLLICYNER